MATITKLKAALAALESAMRQNSHDMLLTGEELRKGESSITDLRSVIAEMEAGEPDIYVHNDGLYVWGAKSNPELSNDPNYTGYFTHPQPKAEPADGTLLKQFLSEAKKAGVTHLNFAQPKAEPNKDNTK
jgi:hypothetical protein